MSLDSSTIDTSQRYLWNLHGKFNHWHVYANVNDWICKCMHGLMLFFKFLFWFSVFNENNRTALKPLPQHCFFHTPTRVAMTPKKMTLLCFKPKNNNVNFLVEWPFFATMATPGLCRKINLVFCWFLQGTAWCEQNIWLGKGCHLFSYDFGDPLPVGLG